MRGIRWAISGFALLLSPSIGAAPSVTLVAPATETRYVAPAAIDLVANPVVDAGRSIALVEFLADGDIIGVATQAPYAFSWANVAKGNYNLRARVIDSQGKRDNSPVVRVHVRNNTAPKVHLSAPEHRYVALGSVPLTAAVTDRDDPIAKVEFFNGDTLLATTTAEPYTFNWTSVVAGNYDIQAKATDALGAIGTSNTFRVRVRDNVAPHVRILVPGNNAAFPAPASIPVSLRANDRDDNLTSVALFANGVQLAAFGAAPYEFNWTNVQPGTYALTAQATDDLGLTTTSRVVTIQITGNTPNVPPTVSLTSPSNNASFSAPASIPLAAAATDSDGTVAKVEFFYGSTLIATRTEAPYSIVWTGVPEGIYALTALVTDNLGASINSSVVNITVTRAEAKLYFIHVDHLNTPRLIADEMQRVVWRWDQQEPFGSNVPDENPSGLGTFDFALRFPGQYFDKETNLAYNSHRDFDPSLGRYLESDPIGIQGGLNSYVYVHDDPLSNVDATGLLVQIKCRPLAPAGAITSRQFFGGRTQRHCFLYVACPEEDWATVLSVQGNLFPLPIFSTGRKVQANPLAPAEGDDPFSPATQSVTITPKKSGCIPCAYEKDIIVKFNNFPSGNIPYDPLGPNSNTFVNYLVNSPSFGTMVPYGLIPNAPALSDSPPSAWRR